MQDKTYAVALTLLEQKFVYMLVEGAIRDIKADKTGDFDEIAPCLSFLVSLRDTYLIFFNEAGVPVPSTPSIQ